jgi:GntR family transcriptional regulator/MocR family aminotransferase
MLNKGTVMKKYSKLYNDIKEQIITGQLSHGDKIPSVRDASAIYSVSTTTVQNAYFELCADGYIISKEKSGYFVSIFNKENQDKDSEKSEVKIEYNFCGESADPESFDLSLWQRYIKNALRQKDRLLTYSQAQGEYDLRCAVSKYIREKRNVTASPDRIVIGAGVGVLLNILASLFDKDQTVSFPDKSFEQGIGIFNDAGFEVHTRDKNADIIYVSPSHMTRWGDVMSNKRRLELVEYSFNNNSTVIEDDYENDFMYNVKPTPALFTLGHGNVIYIGSFSAMLLPGIRISFMVLNDKLTKLYNQNKYKFAQTASKTEQIALCQYIRDGHINSQTRKIRRLYSNKTKDFYSILKKEFANAQISISENTLQIIMSVKFDKDIEVFEKNSISLFVEKYENGLITIVLSPSGIPSSKLLEGAKTLRKAIE